MSFASPTLRPAPPVTYVATSPGQLDHAWLGLRDFLLLLAPLSILGLFAQLVGIESDMQLPRLLWICLAGFAISCWLPLAYRLPFFLALNGIALLLLFDPASAGATLVFGGLLFIAANAPLSLRLRVALVGLLGAYLAVVKAGYTGNHALYQASGILGGLFMFRAALYLYEMQYEKVPVSWLKRAAYFFLVPNLVFQLFPIVDYKTFVRGYYARPAAQIYRKGLYFCAIGVLHLFVYRVLYSYALLPIEDVDTLPALVQYLVVSYALIVRLSGIFHLCVGLVCLFGFDLPRSFNHYFLASSFSDIWLRINVYWRSFVMKLFYFPIYFKLKHLGLRGVFFTVILVFVINFFLHSYQWFWIRGDLHITQTDILFWSILGLALAINSVLASRRGNTAAQRSYSHRRALVHAAKVLGTFASMCVLWALWTSGSVSAFAAVVFGIQVPSAYAWLSLLAGVMLLLLGGVLVQYLLAQRAIPIASPLLERPLAVSLLFLLLSGVLSEQGASLVQQRTGFDLGPLRSEGLNYADERRLTQGYYEELMVPNQLTSRLWQIEEQRQEEQVRTQDRGRGKPWLLRGVDHNEQIAGMSKAEANALREQEIRNGSWVGLGRAGARVKTDDRVGSRFTPNFSGQVRGTGFTTNEHGFRDRPYSLEKPANIYRIAQLGGSPELALGVADEHTADNLLEDSLSQSGLWGDYKGVEILNFAGGNFSLLHQVALTEDVLPAFRPDAVMLYLHDAPEFERMIKTVADRIAQGKTGQFAYIDHLASGLALDKKRRETRIYRMLEPHMEDSFRWGLGEIVRACAENDMRLVVVYMGVLTHEPDIAARNRAILMPMLADMGINVLDVSDIFDGHRLSELIVAPWDLHPNTKAQAIIAERLHNEMLNARALFLPDAGEQRTLDITGD